MRGVNNNKTKSYIKDKNPQDLDFSNSLQELKPFLNKFYMMGSDLCFNVTGADGTLPNKFFIDCVKKFLTDQILFTSGDSLKK
jgi:hypothetical protein